MKLETSEEATEETIEISLSRPNYRVLQPKRNILVQLLIKLMQICGAWFVVLLVAGIIGQQYNIEGLKRIGSVLIGLAMLVIGLAQYTIISLLLLPGFLSYLICFFAYRPLAMRVINNKQKFLAEAFIFLSPLLGYLIFFLYLEMSKIH